MQEDRRKKVGLQPTTFQESAVSYLGTIPLGNLQSGAETASANPPPNRFWRSFVRSLGVNRFKSTPLNVDRFITLERTHFLERLQSSVRFSPFRPRYLPTYVATYNYLPSYLPTNYYLPTYLGSAANYTINFFSLITKPMMP